MKLALVVLACCAVAVSAGPTPAPSAKPTPCYVRIFNGFCYVERQSSVCTFYSTPSFATYNECANNKNLGKLHKCNEVPGDLKQNFADAYKNCADKEVLGGSSGGGGSSGSVPNFYQMSDMDVEGRDIASNGKSFTEECGSLDQIKRKCAQTGGCAGFTYNGKCGYLKTATNTGTKSRRGWTVYAKA